MRNSFFVFINLFSAVFDAEHYYRDFDDRYEHDYDDYYDFDDRYDDDWYDFD